MHPFRQSAFGSGNRRGVKNAENLMSQFTDFDWRDFEFGQFVRAQSKLITSQKDKRAFGDSVQFAWMPDSIRLNRVPSQVCAPGGSLFYGHALHHVLA